MSMPVSHYDNNNNNNNQHDDYGNSVNTKLEQPFDLRMVTDDIPYYDLPAGLMCLLVKVKQTSFKKSFFHFSFLFRMKIVIIIPLIH
jgi:hypothetical protein